MDKTPSAQSSVIRRATSLTLAAFSTITLLLGATPARAATYASSVSGEYYLQSSLDFALEVKFTRASFDNYSFSSAGQTRDFASGGNAAFEWLPMCNYGKLGLGVSFGAIRYAASGNRAMLTALPLHGFVSYRLDYFINQPLVPFGKIGPSYTWSKQGTSPVYGTRGLDYVAGLELSLAALDRSTQRNLDTELGVNQTYAVFEYVSSHSIDGSGAPNTTHAEYRVGLRFEL